MVVEGLTCFSKDNFVSRMSPKSVCSLTLKKGVGNRWIFLLRE